MANGVPANYPRPDPGTVSAGEPVSDPPPQTLLNASNWFAAAPRASIAQPWNYTDDIVRRTAAFPVMPAIGSKGAHVACWPVPAYGVRTELEVYAFGRRDGASGNVRFRSVATGDTADLALGAADGWTSIGSITIDTTGGPDHVELYLEGDGVGAAHVYVAAADFPTITGSLGTPAAGAPTPFDSAELEDDEPGSADITAAFRANLGLFLGWLQTYFCWSGVQNVTSGSKASYSMPEWDHQIITPVHRGQLRRGLTWTAEAQATNVGGGDEAVVLSIGAAETDDLLAIDVPGPAGRSVITETFQPADLDEDDNEVRFVEGVEHPLVFLTIYGDRDYTTAELESLVLYGV